MDDVRGLGVTILGAFASAGGAFATLMVFPSDRYAWFCGFFISGVVGVVIAQIGLVGIMYEDGFIRRKR